MIAPQFYICKCRTKFLHDSLIETACPICGAPHEAAASADVEMVIRYLPERALGLIEELRSNQESLVMYLDTIFENSLDPEVVDQKSVAVVGRDKIVMVVATLVQSGRIDLTKLNPSGLVYTAKAHFWDELVLDYLNQIVLASYDVAAEQSPSPRPTLPNEWVFEFGKLEGIS